MHRIQRRYPFGRQLQAPAPLKSLAGGANIPTHLTFSPGQRQIKSSFQIFWTAREERSRHVDGGRELPVAGAPLRRRRVDAAAGRAGAHVIPDSTRPRHPVCVHQVHVGRAGRVLRADVRALVHHPPLRRAAARRGGGGGGAVQPQRALGGGHIYGRPRVPLRRGGRRGR
jgi:hypothetical protein